MAEHCGRARYRVRDVPDVVRRAWKLVAQTLPLLLYPGSSSRQARTAWIESLRPTWLEVVRPFDRNLEYPFTPAPGLSAYHVEHCRVLPSRQFMVQECLPKNAVVIEVGTYRGDFARLILAGAKPRELHLIDRDTSYFDRQTFRQELIEGAVHLHEGDSAAVLARFPDAYFDWVYIDGDHTYAGVRRDIEQAKTKVKPEGLLVFNDYVFWSHTELMEYGVVRAVNELCVDEGWEIRYLALDSQMYCDVAIARRQD